MVTFRQMFKEDISSVTPLYVEYWNGTGDEWTEELAYKRIWQVLGSPDSYCIIAENGGKAIGFAMGRYETFANATAYNLVEIVVAKDWQNKGIGTKMMEELQLCVKNGGATLFLLDSANDAMHEHFYGKLGFRDATNFKPKVKQL